MRYLSVCSGIEAATVAWHQLGWQPAAFSEIEAFPRAVLTHHYPTVPLHGDFTTIEGHEYGSVDLLVGGTPCQDFSVAGLRAGIAGERGNLTLEFLRLASRTQPRWIVWENVPGVLSSDGGRALGSFLGGLAELGYGFAYRVLDAQYFNLAQRRARVFVVGYLGDWRRAAAVLFERESLLGNPPPRREARKDVAPTISARTKGGGGLGTDFDCDGGLIPEISMCLNAGGMGRQDSESETLIAHSLRAEGFDASEDGTGRGTPIVPILEAGARQGKKIGRESIGIGRPGDPMFTLQATKQQSYIRTSSAVRRLTPRECERLQGFPDDYTLVTYRGKLAADGPRYKALGNSMAVPVMAWIGGRIAMVEAIPTARKAAA